MSNLTDRVIEQHSIADAAGKPASDDGSPLEGTPTAAPAAEFTVFGLAAAALAALLPTVFSPELTYPTFVPKYAVMLLFAAGVVPLCRASKKGRTVVASRAALAFLVVGLISVALSASWNVGLFGLYAWGTGWIFWVCCAGAFALGSRLTRADLPLVTGGIIFAAVVNGLIALVEIKGNLGGALALYQGDQAAGLLGNPIHLEAIELCAVALLAPKAVIPTGGLKRSVVWSWIALVVVTVGLELSLERVAIACLVLIFAVSIAVYRARSLPILGVVAVSYGGAYAALGRGLGSRVLQNGSQETFGSRLHIWKMALTAVAHRPVLGYGPGETISAMAPNMSKAFQTHIGPGTLPTDSHNFFIEVLTTTGVLGLVCFVAWLAGAANRARGPLLAAAACIFFVELVEPLNIGVTPIAFLALGAATVSIGRPVGLVALADWVRRRGSRFPPDDRVLPYLSSQPGELEVAASGLGAGDGVEGPASRGDTAEPTLAMSRRTRIVSSTTAALVVVLSLVLGGTMVAAGYLMQDSTRPLGLSAAVTDALEAQRLTPYFAESSASVTNAYIADPVIKNPLPRVLPWAMKAADLDPVDPLFRTDVAAIYLDLHRYSIAEVNYRHALRLDPWTQQAFLGLASVSAAEKHWATAIAWERDAQEVGNPPSPVLGAQIVTWENDLKAGH
ncbi:MAG: O-antigen ligase family protein [Acidimicrobiales bacterium]